MKGNSYWRYVHQFPLNHDYERKGTSNLMEHGSFEVFSIEHREFLSLRIQDYPEIS